MELNERETVFAIACENALRRYRRFSIMHERGLSVFGGCGVELSPCLFYLEKRH